MLSLNALHRVLKAVCTAQRFFFRLNILSPLFKSIISYRLQFTESLAEIPATVLIGSPGSAPLWHRGVYFVPESYVLPELKLTGLFHYGTVGGPIKREQDEINRGESFFLICPAEFSLDQETVRGKKLLKRFKVELDCLLLKLVCSFSKSSQQCNIIWSDQSHYDSAIMLKCIIYTVYISQMCVYLQTVGMYGMVTK